MGPSRLFIAKRKWQRRALTIPAVCLLLGMWVLLAPVWLAIAALAGIARPRSRWSLLRFSVLAGLYLVLEVAGLVASGWLWLAAGGPFGDPKGGPALEKHFALQAWWAAALFQGIAWLYHFRVSVEGAEDAALGRGPLLVAIRHAGMIDTLIPANFIARAHGLKLRYVLAEQRLMDPCLDVVGNRLPNFFVPSSASRQARLDGVADLASGLGPGDGLLLFPEGRRFTTGNRIEALASLAKHDPTLAARAKNLQHTLPPRAAGLLAALERGRRADVLFVTHRGLERVHKLGDLLGGALVEAQIRVKMWRIPRQQVPETPEARTVWLYEQWERIDQWVAVHGARPLSDDPGAEPALGELAPGDL